MGVWQPIETAPRDGTSVLLWEAFSSVPFVGAWYGRWVVDTEHYDADGYGSVVGNINQKQITKWQPLPELPEDAL